MHSRWQPIPSIPRHLSDKQCLQSHRFAFDAGDLLKLWVFLQDLVIAMNMNAQYWLDANDKIVQWCVNNRSIPNDHVCLKAGFIGIPIREIWCENSLWEFEPICSAHRFSATQKVVADVTATIFLIYRQAKRCQIMFYVVLRVRIMVFIQQVHQVEEIFCYLAVELWGKSEYLHQYSLTIHISAEAHQIK